ncbi:conjugal transfer protein TrbC [Aeromicrobium alkaliterrae]|uniref:Conjugal transfer protein TrbC n=1 Tax=Aeromicrobium alkaliterrae TaxID=302168 RepID=A0ABP4WEF9_9ACTN
MTETIAAQLAYYVTQVPDPGSGTAPPGSEGIITILQWAAWIAAAVCVLGVIIAGAMMAVQMQRGEGGQSVSRLGWVMAGAIVIGSASALVGAIL